MLEELAAIQEDAADTDVEEQVAADNAAMVEAKEEAAEDATAINVTAAPVELLAPAAAENVTATNMTAVPVLGDSSTEDSSEADVPAVNTTANAAEDAAEDACSPNVVEILLANEGNDLLTAYNATLALPEYAAAAEDNAENNPNFTLYAPTDAAVEALAGRLGVEPEALLGADYLDTTAEIVWYHSVSDGGWTMRAGRCRDGLPGAGRGRRGGRGMQ